MDKLWICLLLLAGICAGNQIPEQNWPDEDLYDWDSDSKDADYGHENSVDIDKLIQSEIKQLQDNINDIHDYQFEDNRSENKNNEDDDKSTETLESENQSNQDEVDQHKSLELASTGNEEQEQIDTAEGQAQDASVENKENEQFMDENSDENDTVITKDDDYEIIKETKQLLDDIVGEFTDSNDDDDDFNEEKLEDNTDKEHDITNETNKILNELNEKLDASESLDEEDFEEIIKSNDDEVDENDKSDNDDDFAKNDITYDKDDDNDNNDDSDDDDDTVDKVYADLNDDLTRLSNIWKKLNEDEELDTPQSDDDVLEYEKQFDRPYGEENILNIRDNYDNFDDSSDSTDDDNIEDFNENDEMGDTKTEELKSDESTKSEEKSEVFIDNTTNDPKTESTTKEENLDYYEDEDNDENDEVISKIDENNDEVRKVDKNDNENYNIPSKEDDTNNKSLFTADISAPLGYNGEDSSDDDDSDVEAINETQTSTVKQVSLQENITNSITSEETYDNLMDKFKTEHAEDLDPQSDNFASYVAPIHITLNVGQPVVVTSPNYPSPYPANNMIDWMFEGEGQGIDFRIHDFAVNGLLGDYLLVKPGGQDETGRDGLIFSYTLHRDRRYIFMDVNRMFVRFEARPALPFMRGFNFTVELISPLSSDEDDLPEDPESEAVTILPKETISVHLGGVSMEKFEDIKEDLQELIADMATMYINANGIDPGLNSTETAKITSVTLCNINWPNMEDCVLVTFGVPLVYEDDSDFRLNRNDLMEMWNTYSTEDPFNFRLRRMGITEFVIPNESNILMMWLLIASAVTLATAVVAFVLWKFSCFEDYTRMPTFSDTDSIKNEKRGLDLYPTPHQTLPPLFESEYKWDENKYDDSYRVDIGGYPNKSYIHDDMFNIDSDEEAIPARDRYTTDV